MLLYDINLKAFTWGEDERWEGVGEEIGNEWKNEDDDNDNDDMMTMMTEIQM